jgi:hypothetical protein
MKRLRRQQASHILATQSGNPGQMLQKTRPQAQRSDLGGLAAVALEEKERKVVAPRPVRRNAHLLMRRKRMVELSQETPLHRSLYLQLHRRPLER